MNGLFLNNESSKLPRSTSAVSFVVTFGRKSSVILILCCVEKKIRKRAYYLSGILHIYKKKKDINREIESFVTFLRLL